MADRIVGLSLCVASMVFLPAGDARADDTKIDKKSQVVPKADTLRIVKDLKTVSKKAQSLDEIQIGWPAVVIDVDGQWIQISDEGGYTRPGVKQATGWVRKSDVVLIGSALSTYTDAIIGQKQAIAASSGNTDDKKKVLARLYWLRGIYWETGDQKSVGPQFQLALEDYRTAACLDSTLADAWLRRGRMLAKIDPVESRCGDCGWEALFKRADEEFRKANSPKKCATTKLASTPVPSAPCITSPRPSGAVAGTPMAKDCDDPKNCEGIPVPDDSTITAIKYSTYSPPQLYLDLGLAYALLFNPNSDDKCYFSFACRCFEWAAASNPYWFRPPSAHGDLFAKRARTKEWDLDKLDSLQRPKEEVPSDDLFEAVAWYDKSIRLFDQFDESLRGRAEALRMLLVAARGNKLSRPTIPQLDPHFRDIALSEREGWRSALTAVVDTAYDSANAASLVTFDQDAKSLGTLADVQYVRSSMIGAHISVGYLAQAAETYKQAAARSRSQADADRFYNLAVEANKRQLFVLADLASQVDEKFIVDFRLAEDIKPKVDNLWKKLMELSGEDFQELKKLNRVLTRSILSAHRAMEEIVVIRDFEQLPGPNKPAAQRPAAGVAAILSALKACTQAVAGHSPQSKSTYVDPWPNELPLEDELVSRLARAPAWGAVLDNLKSQADMAELKWQADTGKGKKEYPLRSELQAFSKKWQSSAWATK